MTDHLSPDDQRWCDALAGRLPARNTQAARLDAHANGKPRDDRDDELRMASLLREAMALPDEPPPPPLDDATLTRMMSGLQARGTFDLHAQRQPARAIQGRQTGSPAHTDTHKPQAAWPARGAAGAAGASTSRETAWQYWAMPATAFLAMLAMLWLLNQGQGPQPGPGDAFPKSAGTAFATQQVQARDPDAAAARLVAALSVLGIQAHVLAEGDDRTVQAQVPPQAMAQIGTALQSAHLAAPSDGRLSVRFTLARP